MHVPFISGIKNCLHTSAHLVNSAVEKSSTQPLLEIQDLEPIEYYSVAGGPQIINNPQT